MSYSESEIIGGLLPMAAVDAAHERMRDFNAALTAKLRAALSQL